MIEKHYTDVLDCWRRMVEELAYGKGQRVKWGVCIGFPDLFEANIEDATIDNKLHLEMSSYTKSRWTRFLRRYFRPDLKQWISDSMQKLLKYPNRPFVCSYSINLNPEAKMVGVSTHGGHNYGGCLSSLQIRIKPKVQVILYSRACQLDKIGFLDLCLIHLVAKEVHRHLGRRVEATWVISLPFISAVSQTFYTSYFKLPLKGNALEKRIRANLDRTSNFGPLKRSLKRINQMKTVGKIAGACAVKHLSLDFTVKE